MVVLFPENGVSAIQKAQLTGFKSPRSFVMGLYFSILTNLVFHIFSCFSSSLFSLVGV